ncbi:unnamed protein product [marine sediment metagenome]|uniref:Uncharacterized protein n=1 Tax=marine sediment metagenome TaxID=412755 RepID=X0X2L4_9ZZZZ
MNISLEIREYPLGERISVEELTKTGKKIIIGEAKRLIEELEETEEDKAIKTRREYA